VIVRTRKRLPAIDVARGCALLAMFVYHLMWDLNYFGFIGSDYAASPAAKFFAHTVASAFLLLVGISLSLAAREAPRRAFWQRLGRIALAAAAISLVTWFVFRDELIYFGILHCIALSSLLAWPLRRAPVPIILALALVAIVVPHLFTNPFFDAPGWLWLGLSSNVPASVDYQPLLPGFGLVLIGLASGRLITTTTTPQWLQRPASGPILTTLEFGGKHSLIIYLLHQPVFILMLLAAVQLFGSNTFKFEAEFIDSCQAGCRENATDQRICAESCGCLVRELKDADLWRKDVWLQYLRSTLPQTESSRVKAIVDICARSPKR
jgi:uncharacterized membrane protein